MKSVENLPLAFQPEYMNFVENNIKRKMIVSLQDGRNISLDLNKLPKADSFFDINLEDRMNISAVRLMVGRDTVTISRKKIDGSYLEGFFYYGMARTGLQGYSTLIEYEILGFCYNSLGDSVEFQYTYTDILKQLYGRNNQIIAINDEIIKAEELDNIDKIVELETKVDQIMNSKLRFTIQRGEQKSNVLFVGYPIHLFYKLDEEEQEAFVDTEDRKSEFTKYREFVIQHEQYNQTLKNEPYRNLEEPREHVCPFIPRLSLDGEAPKIFFRIRETGKL